jgi:uncharacterized protein
MTVESTIDYEGLAQEAMRGVVRQVLVRTAKSGLAGDHHFYISFDTEAPGTSLSKRLKEKYPREMTIVLQHRFWDLVVSEDRFEVKLTFDGIPERLVVPFAAIKVFFDPSVRFGLQFEDPNAVEPGSGSGPIESLSQRTGSTRPPRKAQRTAKKLQSVDKRDEPAAVNGIKTEADEPARQATDPIAANAPSQHSTSGEDGPGESSNDANAPPKPGGAEIVSLDKFRKK